MTDNDKKPPVAGRLTRRRLLTRGAAVGAAGLVSGVTGFPFINRMTARAQGAPLKFWQFYAPGGQVVSQSQWFEKMVADWNGSHEQQIELEYVPNNDYMDGTRLPTAFASGEGPDLFIISPGDFLRYYNGGVLLDLTPFIEKEAKADFPETVIANRMVDGKIYGLPMEVEPMAMYYSVAAFEEAGLDRERRAADLGPAARGRGQAHHRQALRRALRREPGLLPELHLVSVHVAGRRRHAGRRRQELVQLAGRGPGAEVLAGRGRTRAPRRGRCWVAAAGTSVPNLGSGYCAMQNVGIWAIAQLREGGAGLQVRRLQAADAAGGKYVTVGGGWAFVANAKGANPEAAGEFCAWALASMSRTRSSGWSTGARSPRATCRRATARSRRAARRSRTA